MNGTVPDRRTPRARSGLRDQYGAAARPMAADMVGSAAI
jgi:hypothetical protein